MTKTLEDVAVWQKAHQWVLAIYRFTEQFPKQELFGLTSQLRRAAVSVPANIAEGYKRQGKAEKARFYNIAQASLEECRYYLILYKRLKLWQYARTNPGCWRNQPNAGCLHARYASAERAARIY